MANNYAKEFMTRAREIGFPEEQLPAVIKLLSDAFASGMCHAQTINQEQIGEAQIRYRQTLRWHVCAVGEIINDDLRAWREVERAAIRGLDEARALQGELEYGQSLNKTAFEIASEILEQTPLPDVDGMYYVGGEVA